MRLSDLVRWVRGGADGDAPPDSHGDGTDVLRLAKQRDPAGHRLYEALSSEANLHLALARALFAHHDRRLARRRRTRMISLGLVAFVGFNVLDFTISNL